MPDGDTGWGEKARSGDIGRLAARGLARLRRGTALAFEGLMHAAPHYADEFHENEQPAGTLVVLAEADSERRDARAEALIREGYDVIALETGPQLLQYLYNSVVHEARPDLVICDAELEGIDGAQICKISRAQNTLLPFIVLARHGTAGDFDSLELNEEACVLSADVGLDELRAAVVRLAGGP